MSTASSYPVYAGTKRPLTIDDQDEDVRIAVRALGDMRSRTVAQAHAPSAEAFAEISKAHSRASSISRSTPFLTRSSTSVSTSNSSPVLPRQMLDSTPIIDNSEDNIDPSLRSTVDPSSKDFVSRVSHLPIVNSALKVYENTKECSKVVKYGATLMESSVKTISRPVINRLPVGQIDEFACRQLDRFRCGLTPLTSDAMQFDEPSSSFHVYREHRPVDSTTSSRAQSAAPSSTVVPREISEVSAASEEHNAERQVTNRSKWQTVLSEAGGISAAVSEESMKRLQYCLHWLQFATERIDTQIAVLRSFIDTLTPQSSHENGPPALVPLQAMRTLSDVRRDVVNTIRQVVDVISKYAGGALPEPARSTVRSIILRLPARWANANGDSAGSNNSSMPSSPNISPKLKNEVTSHDALSPFAPSSSHTLLNGRPTAGRATHPSAVAATQAAQRILTLATESLDMMRSVTNVFKESLERAETWVERLRVVGIQRHGPPPPLSSPGVEPSTTNNDPAPKPAKAGESEPQSPSIPSSTVPSTQSLTSLPDATQTSPPTSVASSVRRCERPGSGASSKCTVELRSDESVKDVTEEAKQAEVGGASKKMDIDT
ncbi:transcription factor Opi1-domain-containing protein [Hysterangium stoloniferum]|nr:transcription factor Opi1-domain-containing protein [Hysterangium stoloniferum]